MVASKYSMKISPTCNQKDLRFLIKAISLSSKAIFAQPRTSSNHEGCSDLKPHKVSAPSGLKYILLPTRILMPHPNLMTKCRKLLPSTALQLSLPLPLLSQLQFQELHHSQSMQHDKRAHPTRMQSQWELRGPTCPQVVVKTIVVCLHGNIRQREMQQDFLKTGQYICDNRPLWTNKCFMLGSRAWTSLGPVSLKTM